MFAALLSLHKKLRAAWLRGVHVVRAFVKHPTTVALLAQLAQPSTRRGIVAILAVGGHVILPDRLDIYADAVITALGILAILSQETPKGAPSAGPAK